MATPTEGNSFKGRHAEYLFAAQCALRGFVIGFPSVEGITYDFFVSTGNGFVRKVQVKGCYTRTGNRYLVTLQHGATGSRKTYLAADYDYLAVYIHDYARFYIIPRNMVPAKKTLTFNWESCENQWKPYLNNWDALATFT